jgi:hypothetical protein
MLLSTSEALSTLDDYGIRDITSPTPVIGLAGILREGALFISTHFDFIGSKVDELQLYAFPRNDINGVLISPTPEPIFEAQKTLLVKALGECLLDTADEFGKGRLTKWRGSTRTNAIVSTDPFYLKVKAILAPLLTTNDSQTFIVE